MRNLLIALFVAILAFPQLLFSQQETIPTYLKVSITVPKAKLSSLLEQGMEFDHGRYDVEAGTWTTVIKEKELEVLKQNKIPYEILIEDLNRHYNQDGSDLLPEEKTENSQQRLGFTGWDCDKLDYPTPTLFPYPNGSMGGFLTFSEIVAHLDLLATTYPNLVTVKQSIGQSHEGRDLWVVKISDNPTVDESEPEIFYNALIHAREPMAAASLIFYMDYLLQHYATNPEIKDLVDNTEMYFLPVYNPDGYVYNETTNPNGGGLWRKNRRNNGSNYGVDLNRNYGHQWGYNNTGSSGNTSSTIYRGPSPFSEPETQAVRDFTLARNFGFIYNIHTYGDYLIHPFEYINAHPSGIDGVAFTRMGRDLCQHNHYKVGNTFGTLAYFVNGGSNDWCYGDSVSKPKIFSYVPEIGISFWPPVAWAADYGREMMYPYLKAAFLVGDYAEFDDWDDATVLSSTGYFPFRLTRTGLKAGGTWTISVQPLQGIASVGAPAVVTGLSLYQEKLDSVSFTLSPGFQAGNLIRYVWEVNNGSYTLRDTVTKIYQPTLVFSDNCETLTNWTTTGSWGLSTDSYEGTMSITDSPAGNYNTSPNTSYVYLNQGLDLTTAVESFLTLWIKFQTAVGRDFVQIEASPNGHGPSATGYQPVCGNLAQPGTGKNFIPASGPIYHGDFPKWRKETLSLYDFVGRPDVGIRIKMVVTLGNINTPADGFYIDKVSVVASGQPNPFPVDLLSFSAKWTGNTALLSWQTSGEVDTNYFVVERSIDGLVFESLGMVAVNQDDLYTHSDDQVANMGVRKVYYRLKMTDQDGHVSHSKYVTLSLPAGQASLSFYPNPATTQLTISGLSQVISIKVFDPLGREIADIHSPTGNILTLQTQNWKRGIYFVQVNHGSGQLVEKVILD